MHEEGAIRPTTILLVLLALLASGPAPAEPATHLLASPDGRIEVRVSSDESIRYDVLLRGEPLLSRSTLSIDIDHVRLGLAPRVKAATPTSVDREIEPHVRQKRARLRERYNQLRLELDGDYAVTFRAYDEGVAYRFETSLKRDEVRVYAEEAGFNFAGGWSAYYPREESFFSQRSRVGSETVHRSRRTVRRPKRTAHLLSSTVRDTRVMHERPRGSSPTPRGA